MPSYSDSSLIRNYLAYKSGQLLEGIGYVPKCEFVEVYLNGSYNGVYLLVERVAVESSKVNIIEANADELTGGYLTEKDVDGKIDYAKDQWFNCPYWANQSRDYLVLKDPEPNDPELLAAMLEYLEGYMLRLHGAVMGESAESYTQYVDVPSWTDFIILQELAKNIDGNLKTSCYMYKQAGDDKLYFTAPWDFDLAFGNPACDWNNADHIHNDYYDCPDATSPADFMTINSSCPWFDTLYDDHAEFRDALKQRYEGYRETLVAEMLRIIDAQAAYLSQAVPRDEQMWGNNFDRGVEQLGSWLADRIEWLDSQWLDVETIDLDTALNTEGGSLHFATSQHPFIGTVKDGRIAAVSGIRNINNAESSLYLTLEMQEGETLCFDYMYSTEHSYDTFTFAVNGQNIFTLSGEADWQTHTYTAQSDGSYTFVWHYQKDYSDSYGSDCVWIDEVIYSGAGAPALLGDTDGSGSITIEDALLALRCGMGLITLDEAAAARADMDSSGDVTVSDALLILRRAMGIL